VKFSIQKSYKVIMLTPAIFGIGLLAMGSPACAADEVAELKAQLKALQQRIEVLEKRPVETQVVTTTGEKVAAPAKPVQKGYFVIPGTETSLKIGGYAKLDAIYNDTSAGDNSAGDQLFLPYTIPLDKTPPNDGQTVLHARQTRFNVGTTTDTAYGKLNTFFEGDFFGTSGPTASKTDFRVRHAYGELGKLLAGQTWSTFEIMDSLPDTVDFGGPAAQTFMRQGLIRWTEPFAWGSLQFAVEDPSASFDDTTPSVTTDDQTDDDHVADMIARVNFKSEYGSYSVAAMARELTVDTGVVDDSAWGGAITFGGKIPTFGKDDLRFQLNYGNALGRYVTTQFKDAEWNSVTNEVETFDQYGGFLAYRHFWMDNLRSNLVYSYGAADNDVAISGTSVNKEFQSVHANLIWSIVPSVDLGVEFLHGYREIESGDEGELNRIQFMAMYNFF